MAPFSQVLDPPANSGRIIVHLLLDSVELKYSAGVQFFVPFSWTSIEFGFVHTSGILSISITVFGFIASLYMLYRVITRANRFFTISTVLSPFTLNSPRIYITSALLLPYISMPLLLIEET